MDTVDESRLEEPKVNKEAELLLWREKIRRLSNLIYP